MTDDTTSNDFGQLIVDTAGLDERQIARVQALRAAADTAADPSKMRRDTWTVKAPHAAQPGSLKHVFQKVFDGNTTPGTSAERHTDSEYGDYLLRAATWIVDGHDPDYDAAPTHE